MSSAGNISREPRSAYWDRIFAETQRAASAELWPAYMRQIYRRLLKNWLPQARSGIGLKADLFEEASGAHPILPDLGADSVGIDCSPVIVRTARTQLKSGRNQYFFVVGDLRWLPFRTQAVSYILAGSSLDHFSRKEEIVASLAEAARILAPGGILVVTFDNPHNPLVWLRNHLPFPWLYRLGLVPYYVGATCTRTEACHYLEAVGFRVTHVTAVVHVPRAPAIWLIKLVEAMGWKLLGDLIARVLISFERLESWPIRYQTGYYLALRAEKRVD